jgi:hypothetical protein
MKTLVLLLALLGVTACETLSFSDAIFEKSTRSSNHD